MKIKIGTLTSAILRTFRYRYYDLPQHLMLPFPIRVNYGKTYEHR